MSPSGGPHVWIDTDRDVSVDWPCVQCGYNLRSLPAIGNCPECGSSVRQSAPLEERDMTGLRRFRNATFWLAASSLIAVFISPGYEALLKRIRPPSVMLWDLPPGETVQLHPWTPWAWLVGSLLAYAAAAVTLFAVRRYVTARVELGVSRPPLMRATLPLWKLAVCVLVIAFVTETMGSLGGPSVIWTPNAIMRLLEVSLWVYFAIAIGASLQGVLVIAQHRLISRVVRWLCVVAASIGMAIIAKDALLTLWFLSTPPRPQPMILDLAHRSPPEYVILDQYGRATSTTTAPAAEIARTKRWQDALKPGAPTTWMFDASRTIERWFWWPGVVVGSLLLIFLAGTGFIAHRAINSKNREPGNETG